MKRIYAANEEQWRKVCEKSWYRDKTLCVDEIEKAIILPLRKKTNSDIIEYCGGVCTENFDFIAGLLRQSDNPKDTNWLSVNASYSVNVEEIKMLNEEIIFGGVLFCHFGHFLLECMNRFWYMLQHPEDQRRIAFITDQKCNFFYDFFDLLGFERERILFVEYPTQFLRVIVPEESAHSWHSYTDSYRVPHNALVNNCGKGNFSKIYLSRSNFTRKGGIIYFNENYFESFYSKKKFHIIYPELLPLKEQIRIVAGADEVISTLSTLSHFALFCRPKTKFTILTRVDNTTLNPQCLINEASSIDYTIVDISRNLLYADRTYGPCLFGPTKYWQKYINDRYDEEVDANIFKSSVWEYLYNWSEFYSDQGQFKKIQNKDAYDFLDRLYRTTHDKPLPFKRPTLTPSERSKKDIECIRLRNMLKNLQYLFGDTDQFVHVEKERPLLQADIHVSTEGWINKFYETEEWQGQKDPKRQIEALRCRFTDTDWQLSYRVRDRDGHWGEWVTNGELAGITGKSAPITGIAFRLDSQSQHSVRYRIKSTKSGSEWSAWEKDGTDCVVDVGFGIVSIQVELINKAFAQSES